MIDRRFYVYVIFRLDGSPCYIGKGTRRRWLQHEAEARSGRHPNKRLTKIILAATGRELPKLIIRNDLTHAEACDIERAFISAIGRGSKGPLVNYTDGGEGTAGFTRTPEDAARIGKLSGDARRGKKYGPMSPERRAAISQAKTGVKINRQPGSSKGIPKSKDHARAIAAAVRAAYVIQRSTPEGREAFSKRSKAGWIKRRASASAPARDGVQSPEPDSRSEGRA